MRESGDIISEGGVVNLVNEDPQECRGFVARIGLELWVDFDYKRGGDGRKQTCLLPSQHAFITTRGGTYEDQSSV